MASKETVMINFKNAMAQADKLDNVARKLENVGNNEINSALVSISSNWTGESANAFIGKGKILQKKVGSTASSLHAIAQEIRRNARAIYAAEIASIAVAESRTC